MGHESCRRRAQCNAAVRDELRDERVAREQSRRQNAQSTLQFPGRDDTIVVCSCHAQEAQSHSTDGSTRSEELLHTMQELETAKDASLFDLQDLRAQDGPPLPLDRQLRGVPQLQSILPVLSLPGCKSRHPFLFSGFHFLSSLLYFSWLAKSTGIT